MKVVITDKMAEEAIELLKDAGHDVTFDEMDIIGAVCGEASQASKLE